MPSTSSGLTISTGFMPPARNLAPRNPRPSTSTAATTRTAAPMNPAHSGSSRSIRRRRSAIHVASMAHTPIGRAACEGESKRSSRSVPTRNCSAIPTPSSVRTSDGTAGEPA